MNLKVTALIRPHNQAPMLSGEDQDNYDNVIRSIGDSIECFFTVLDNGTEIFINMTEETVHSVLMTASSLAFPVVRTSQKKAIADNCKKIQSCKFFLDTTHDNKILSLSGIFFKYFENYFPDVGIFIRVSRPVNVPIYDFGGINAQFED
jgi:hypothetical protein